MANTQPATAFDTLRAARRLEAAGVARRQAEAIAEAIANSGDRAATRADLDATAAQIDDKIDTTAARIDEKVDASTARLDEKIDASNAHLDAKIDSSTAHLDAKIDASNARLDEKATRLDEKIDASTARIEDRIDNNATKADLYRIVWIQTGAIVGTMVALAGAIIAIVELS